METTISGMELTSKAKRAPEGKELETTQHKVQRNVAKPLRDISLKVGVEQ